MNQKPLFSISENYSQHCQATLSWSKYYSLVSIGVSRSGLHLPIQSVSRWGPGWLIELGHIPFAIFESVNICLKHFVKVSAVDKGRFRFTISWPIIASDFVTAFRRSISLKNRANGLRTAIKTHGTLFVHQRKGKLSFTAPSVPLTLHVLTEAKVDGNNNVIGDYV
jgi:hypothetical protein